MGNRLEEERPDAEEGDSRTGEDRADGEEGESGAGEERPKVGKAGERGDVGVAGDGCVMETETRSSACGMTMVGEEFWKNTRALRLGAPFMLDEVRTTDTGLEGS